MSSDGSLNPESDSFESRPPIYIGQHDTGRKDTLTNGQYRKVISSGASLQLYVHDRPEDLG